MTHRKAPKWLTRDLVLLIFGLAGIGHETIAEHGDRPTLLILFGAMIGLPGFLRVDESRAKNKNKPDEDGPP